jgi:cytochrome P450
MATLAAPGIDPLDVTRPELYRDDLWHAPFRELRERAPVHYTPDSAFGPYWSVSTYQPIVEVESLPDLYSSAQGIAVIDIAEGDKRLPMFIAMDRPKHTGQRRTIAPAFTPSAMADMAGGIRARTGALLDSLPHGAEFDWVDRVSIELTTQMLALLFAFPWEQRRKLTYWSDWAGDIGAANDPAREEARRAVLFECAAAFTALWQERLDQPPAPDLISMMLHSDAMSAMDRNEFLGNLILLIVGGNDTTRNSMSAYAWGLSQFPEARAQLEADPGLIPNAVQELLRWQTPLAHMRRTATRDCVLEGQRIREGDKLVLWYLSANRDESVFPEGDRILVDRPNARRHLAFGHGIHRCVGARLAELQLAILLEEMAARRLRVEPLRAPERVAGCFSHGYRSLPVALRRY